MVSVHSQKDQDLEGERNKIIQILKKKKIFYETTNNNSMQVSQNFQPPVVQPTSQIGQILPPVTPQQKQRKRKQQIQKTKPHLHASVYILCFFIGLILVVLGFLFYFVFVRKTVSIQVTSWKKNTDGKLTTFDYYYKDNSSKTGTMYVPNYIQQNYDLNNKYLTNFQNSNNPISLYANKKNILYFKKRNKAAYLSCWIVGFSLVICGLSYFFDKH